MAGTSATLPVQEMDVAVLKETLRSQQQLLQKLYSELDVERESSATATNESLAMILRLQSEKAVIKMEASQYKRLAEEKIGHAEESLAIFEELMYQKEMEISSLEYQVQAYRYKLLSLGCDDLNDFETQFTSNRFAERNDGFIGEKGIQSTLRRLRSLPASLPVDFSSKKNTNGGESIEAPLRGLCSSTDSGNSDTVVRAQGLGSRKSSVNSAAGEFKSYSEQIRLLDEKVRQIADCSKEADPKKILNAKAESMSLNSSSLNECHEDSTELSISSPAFSSSVVHDIFEVPVIHEVSETSAKSRTCFDGEKCTGKSVLENDDRLTKPDLIPEDNLGLAPKCEIDWIKMNSFLSAMPEGKSCKGNDLPAEHGTEFIKVNKLLITDADYKSALGHIAAGITDNQSELKQLSLRVENLESGRSNTRQEIVDSREEELNLLKDLREQLNSIQSQIQSSKPKKPSSHSDEVSLVPLTEAMMYFWL